MELLSDAIESKKNYDAFIKRLDDSSFGVFIIAWWFHKNGRTVRIPPIHHRPFYEKAEKHVDNGDLFVTDKDGKESLIEVKHLTANFTCLQDWPFPDMIVSSVDSVDRRRGQVKAYIMLNKNADYIAILPCDDTSKWKKISRFSKNINREQEYYVCDPASCKFICIGEKE